jgi:hypothetical protein
VTDVEHFIEAAARGFATFRARLPDARHLFDRRHERPWIDAL